MDSGGRNTGASERPASNAQAQTPRPEGAGMASSNSAEFTPEDIRWAPGRDPARFWALTRAQPVASLLVAGRLWGFTRSVPPPPQLIGRRLIITAGSGHQPFKHADEAGELAVLDHCGVALSPAEIPSGRARMFREAVHGLPKAVPVGAVRLAAAFRIANVIGGTVYADVHPGSAYRAPSQMGTWREFDKMVLPRLEPLARGRWMWCVDAAHAFGPARQVPVKGFGGIWDYEEGLALRAAEVAAEGATPLASAPPSDPSADPSADPSIGEIL